MHLVLNIDLSVVNMRVLNVCDGRSATLLKIFLIRLKPVIYMRALTDEEPVAEVNLYL